jgi:peptidase E
MEPDNPLLDDWLLSLVDRARPKVCFVPTASGDADGYVVRFYDAFGKGRAEPSHLALFDRSIDDLRGFVLAQDIIYVGGGNTANMLAVWRAHGLDEVLREAWQQGAILAGLSAGSICWYEAGITDSFGTEFAPLRDGLGFLPGSHCPHFDEEPERRPKYEELVRTGELPGGVAADDGAALMYEGTELVEVVSSRPAACAHRLQAVDSELHVEVIQARYLGETEEDVSSDVAGPT